MPVVLPSGRANDDTSELVHRRLLVVDDDVETRLETGEFDAVRRETEEFERL